MQNVHKLKMLMFGCIFNRFFQNLSLAEIFHFDFDGVFFLRKNNCLLHLETNFFS